MLQCTGHYFDCIDVLLPGSDETAVAWGFSDNGAAEYFGGPTNCADVCSQETADAIADSCGAPAGAVITLLLDCVGKGDKWRHFQDELSYASSGEDDQTFVYPSGPALPGPAVKCSPTNNGMSARATATDVRLKALDWMSGIDRSSLTSLVKEARGWGDRLSIDRNQEEYDNRSDDY